MPSESFEKIFKITRKVLTAVGVVALGVALAADFLGISQPGQIGIGQFLLGAGGVALLCAGLLGRLALTLYKNAAVLLLNIVVLLAGLELASIVIYRTGIIRTRSGVIAASRNLSYYASQDWARTYWNEAKMAVRVRYEPYVIWRNLPFQGKTIHINEEGVRATPGADCSEGSFTVFTFGGSTMWGWGAPDDETIAAHLQEILEERIQGPLCVVNYGEDAYVSTQELVTLVRLLQRGNVPDAVVFYDGVNDVYAAYESGLAGVHPSLAKVASSFEQPALLNWLRGTRLSMLIRHLAGGREAPPGRKDAKDRDRLARAVVQAYLANYRAVSGLAREYGFKNYFFWQPHIAVGNKPLTREEQDFVSEIDPDWRDLSAKVYDLMVREADRHDRIYSLHGVFDGLDTLVWIDFWGHITPEGNRTVAREMARAMGGSVCERTGPHGGCAASQS